jgi:putative ABC transport system permease protein
MIRNFFTLLVRNLFKNKVFTLVNFLNLVIGYATFILFSCFIYDELNWDIHNKNYDRIYRVQLKIDLADGAEINQYTPSALAYHVLDTMAGIEKHAVIDELNNLKGMFLSREGKEPVNEKMGWAAESAIFDIFSFRFIEGTPTGSIDEPNEVVLSESVAVKLFGKQKALGQFIVMDKKLFFKVTGVYKDLPENSHFRPAFMISMAIFKILKGWDYQNDWWQNICFNYVLLYPNVRPEAINRRIDKSFNSITDRQFYHPFLRPLSKLHLSPTNRSDNYVVLSILSLAALLLLILSAINYVNLNTANATSRAKEIGIKKVVGGSRQSLIVQFLAESVLLTSFAVLAGLLITDRLIPSFKLIIHRNLEINIWHNSDLLIFLCGFGLITGVLAGLYPALVISSFKPARVLKGSFFNSRNGAGLKKILTTAQFSISIYILVSSLIVYRQVHFITGKDMGFTKENMLYAKLITFDNVRYESLRQRMLSHPEIENFSFSHTIPFDGDIGGYFDFEGAVPGEKISTSRNYVTYDFIPTYGIRLKEGRNFSRDLMSDREACIINETALKAFGWKDDPIGKKIAGNQFTVIGVVRDFHQYTPYMEIPPYFMLLKPDTVATGIYTVRYRPGMRNAAKKAAEAELSAFLPRDPFEFKDYTSAMESDNTLQTWQSVERLTGLYAILAICISSIGLFGLILFTTQKRIKEIGVRKVFGGSVKNIFGLMTFEIFKLIFISVLIAFPAAMYLYDELPGAYKYHMQVWEFVTALGITVIVAFLTISFQILRASRISPVKALRYE